MNNDEALINKGRSLPSGRIAELPELLAVMILERNRIAGAACLVAR
jgi:hypothetical protein